MKFSLLILICFFCVSVQAMTEQEAKAINCERAKIYLAEITSKARIKIISPNGEIKFLSPSELEAEIVKTKQAIQQYCPPKN